MSKEDNSHYVVEYNNGEVFEDSCNYILIDLFKTLKNAKEYVKGLSLEIYPEDYEDSVRDKIPERLYYTKEGIDASGNFMFELEYDKYEDYCYTSDRRFSTYRIHKVILRD